LKTLPYTGNIAPQEENVTSA